MASLLLSLLLLLPNDIAHVTHKVEDLQGLRAKNKCVLAVLTASYYRYGSGSSHAQADQAVLITQAAFKYKLSLDSGEVARDYLNVMPQCIGLGHWLSQAQLQAVYGAMLEQTPEVLDVVNQRQFQRGRTDCFNAFMAEMVAFCDAVDGDSLTPGEKRKLLLEAVKSHSKLVAVSVRGRGTGRAKMFTSFDDLGAVDLRTCWGAREATWVVYKVDEERKSEMV
ncbi:hypothetical protein M406DRAFT_334203 [Cryphonectria parasitica EP155]|uniref:Choline/carnitine acyltransferase domain-containing protein n=1 Tax=Cryphonectria parasitica (strain ATCC 38755 / EP155) TaxID=660469 RepID=A0A9P4XTJ3_CRYP1|nr:uncharacterized protein M406DRAFT_334203 [Cryphonectria parasitica EP155]KAF3760571.1 hypothetical protein M406DRAFT_334203 [Cryphonectria parasitica EP155]